MSDSSSPVRIVLHVSERATDLVRAVDTTALLLASYPGAAVRVIVNGPALAGLPDLPAEIVPSDLEVAACALGLERNGITLADLPRGIGSVPSAPVALVAEQLAGAVYLRL